MIEKVLVTGASGFLGAWVAKGLARRGYAVMALGGTREVPRVVSGCVAKFACCELGDTGKFYEIVGDFRPDAVVNCAALAQADACERDPRAASVINGFIPELLLSAFREARGSDSLPFVHISTDLVFDGAAPSGKGFAEGDVCAPQSVYARTKLEGEKRVLNAGGNGWVFRTSLIYGPRIGEREGFMSWMRGALASGNPVKLFVDEFRTPIFVEDVAHVLDLFFRRELYSAFRKERGELSLSGASHILHVAGPERISRYDFGKTFAEIFEFDPALLLPAQRDQDGGSVFRPADVSLQIERLVKLLNYTPLTPREGLLQMRG